MICLIASRYGEQLNTQSLSIVGKLTQKTFFLSQKNPPKGTEREKKIDKARKEFRL